MKIKFETIDGENILETYGILRYFLGKEGLFKTVNGVSFLCVSLTIKRDTSVEICYFENEKDAQAVFNQIWDAVKPAIKSIPAPAKCSGCNEYLADNVYFTNNKSYCSVKCSKAEDAND